MLRSSGLVLGLAIALAPGLAIAQLTASIDATRTRGVAPLAVVFNGSNSTHSNSSIDVFHDLAYQWDFGDAGAGLWQTNNRSKNNAYSVVSGHVYETPGSYTVTLTVTDGSGGSATRQTTITVDDPDVVFSGGQTYCFSPGNFTGCPSGAQQVTTNSWGTIVSYVAPGRRLLLRRGQTFNGVNGGRIDGPGPGIIGAFGTGTNPVITGGDGKTIEASGRAGTFDNWRIMDLEFRGPNNGQGRLFSAEGQVHNLLLLRLKGSNYHGGIFFADSILEYWGAPGPHEGIAVVECDLSHLVGGGGGNGMYVALTRSMVMGNNYRDMAGVEHVIRMPHFSHSILSDNYLAEPAAMKHVLKLHAGTWQATPSAVKGRLSERFVVADNTFKSLNNDWAVALGPQNGKNDERVQDGIVERNYFDAGPGTQIQMVLWTRSMTVRNNIFDMSNSEFYTGVRVTQRNQEPPPRDNRFYNNTCYTNDSGANLQCLDNAAANTQAYNNLAYAPNGSVKMFVGGVTPVQSNNVAATSNPFVSSNPGSPPDFLLRSSASAAIDKGLTLKSNRFDFSASPRPVNGLWDAGAFEFGSADLQPPSAPILLP